jgi:PAS domain-containing protein
LNNETKHIEIHLHPIKKGNTIEGVTCFVMGATERKKAEEALRHSEETKRLIMNSSMDAIICIDTNGIITVWTPQAENLFGWKEEEVIGKCIRDDYPGNYQTT